MISSNHKKELNVYISIYYQMKKIKMAINGNECIAIMVTYSTIKASGNLSYTSRKVKSGRTLKGKSE